ncbi:MAG: GAF domain-containing protein [Anaerolineae bacterium]|nr:GAF domain-containing protein [Anaerolineae bacterium]
MTSPEQAREQVSQLGSKASEVTAALQRQQELLQLRGLSLQPGLVNLLLAVESGIGRLGNLLNNDAAELRQLRALVHTSALINSSFELDTVLERAMDAVLQFTGAERGYILLTNDEGKLETYLARTRVPGEDDEGLSQSIINQVMTSGKPLLTDNAAHDPRIAGSATVTRYVLRSVLCVPLVFKGKTEGVIYADNRLRVAVFTGRELTLLSAIANQIAVAIANARLFVSVQANLREITQATELMENVFASIASGVVTADVNDLVIAWNAAAARMLRLSTKTAHRKPLRDVLPLLPLDVEDALLSVREHHQSQEFEVETEVHGRGRVVLNLKVGPLKSHEGEEDGVIVVLDDLTHQRANEETLDLLRRYLPPGMIENIHEIASLGLGGERREVSCMFVDMGPLAQFGARGTAQMMDTLNLYLETITTIVHNAGGLIDKYMGQEIMALYNTQLNPQADHAARALETALQLQDAIQTLNARHGIDNHQPSYRIGIHTGVATMGNIGGVQRRSFTALGDSINLAKRLEEYASGGQILISEETMNRVQGKLPSGSRCEECPAIQVKGRQQLTRIYKVTNA